MLFASYQALDFMEAGNRNDYSIWALPVKSIKEFFISSRFCAPNKPEVLVFFDCDDYLRIDKITWYQAIKKADADKNSQQPHNPIDFVSTDVDDLHSEFLVKGIETEKIRRIIPIIAIGESTNILGLANNKETREVELFLCEKSKNIKSLLNIPVEINANLGMSKDYAKYRAIVDSNKMAFELVYLPIVVASIFAGNKPLSVDILFYSEMISCAASTIIRLNNRFTMWSLQDCSIAEYDSLVEQLGHCVIDNSEIVCRLRLGPPIGRNEHCPCGSGKKWKKCHGAWID